MLTPSAVNLNKSKNLLTITFENKKYHLSAEFLRVYSPSAEVMGHGPGQEVLQVGKESVTITGIRPSGNYAIILTFSDKHNTGIYSWSYLHSLCSHNKELWNKYIKKLQDAGHKHKELN